MVSPAGPIQCILNSLNRRTNLRDPAGVKIIVLSPHFKLHTCFLPTASKQTDRHAHTASERTWSVLRLLREKLRADASPNHGLDPISHCIFFMLRHPEGKTFFFSYFLHKIGVLLGCGIKSRVSSAAPWPLLRRVLGRTWRVLCWGTRHQTPSYTKSRSDYRAREASVLPNIFL